MVLRKCLICLLCSSLESSELFLRFTDSAGEELLLLCKQLDVAWIRFLELFDILELTLRLLDFCIDTL